MKYLVRDCDPNTGEPDDDGYEDEYVVSSPILILAGEALFNPRVICTPDPLPL